MKVIVIISLILGTIGAGMSASTAIIALSKRKKRGK